MTKTFSASVEAWSAKAKRNAKLVVMEASEAVYNAMTERQAGVKETGGAFEIGKVPVDTGFLVNSAQVALNGTVTGTGNPAFIGAIAGFQIGQPIEAGFTASYAPVIEYGSATMGGRFFVREAVSQWPAFVAAAAARYKDT